jgi:glycosyltransferase involved in cell wall biosynthesis
MRNPLPLNTQFGGGKQGDYVLYFGRLSEEKGVRTLLDAAKETGCRLVVLGTGPVEEELKDYAKNMPNVEFKGFQTGKPLEDFVKNSLCVVLPSEWYENGPYSAMEAMAAGKPLIVSGNGGLPELVDEGKNGYVYRGGAEELAEAIRKMQALTGEEYEKMSLRAVEKAKALFDPMGYVVQLEEQCCAMRGETVYG